MGVPRTVTHFKQAEIRTLFKKSRLIHTDQYMRIYKAPATGTPAKILIILSKKVGNAPHRNKMRRRIKEAFGLLKLPEKSFDYIVRFAPVKHEIDLSFSALYSLLASLATDEKNS